MGIKLHRGFESRPLRHAPGCRFGIMPLPPGPRSAAALNTVRFLRRPRDMLQAWHARYGDVFTVDMLGFGIGVYVADPDAIRELFTGDQSDLRAGEANSFMEPVLGAHSVLVLDGQEHLRQRKLLLPPFQGSRVTAFREVIREVAEREVARWNPGSRIVLRARMRSLTFEVICRAVFGVTEPERVARLRRTLGARRQRRPVIDAAERTLTRPRTVAGWDLPAGVKVYPGILLVQLREDLYPQPHRFMPERFLEDGAESYSWLPFGGGTRRCIGAALAQAEMAEVLRVVLSAVQLRPLRSHPEPVVMRGITLAPKHGVR